MSLTKLSLAGNNVPNPSPRKVWSKIIQESRNIFYSVTMQKCPLLIKMLPERAVSSEAPVARPVLQVDRELVERGVVLVGERPDEDVAQPELTVKVPEADLVVLPPPHEVLVRLHVVPHLLKQKDQ